MASLRSAYRLGGPTCPSAAGLLRRRGGLNSRISAHKVEIEHQGETHVLEVEEGVSILEAALENDLQLPHDCQLGVCMTCPARLIEGEVDMSLSSLAESVEKEGYALLCVSQPLSDVKVKTINEDELVNLQFATEYRKE